MIFAMNIVIPDINIPIDLGTTSISFTLKDMTFEDLQANEVFVQFEDDVPAQGGISDTFIKLSF